MTQQVLVNAPAGCVSAGKKLLAAHKETADAREKERACRENFRNAMKDAQTSECLVDGHKLLVLPHEDDVKIVKQELK